MRRGRRERRRRRIGRASALAAPILLGITLGLGPQLLGGVFGWGIATITGLAGLTCIAAAWSAHRDGTSIGVSYLGGAAILGLGWTLLQALPLPRGLTDALQPRAVGLADDAAMLLGDVEPAWVAISIAPGATWAQVVQGAGLVAAFLAATTIVSLGHRRRVFRAVGISAGLMAAVALMHLAAGADEVFGVYAPIHTTNPLLAPIVNQNQLSGFLAMCAPLLVGLGLDSDDKRKRVMWIGIAVVVGACSLMAVSRGGAASLVVGFLALGLFGSFRRTPSGAESKRTPLVLVGAAFAAAVGLGLYVAAESLYRDFEQSGLEKLELAARGLDLALDHAYVGVGRGAFSAAFVARYGEAGRATHPENLLAQWCAEWGFVVAGLLLVALTLALWRAAKRARSWAHIGGVAGLVGIFAHDLVDFSLELAGVAVVAAALLGAVCAPSRRSKRATRRVSVHRVAGAMGVACVLLALVPGLSLDSGSVFTLQRSLESDMRDGRRGRFRETLVEAVRGHPSEPAFVLLGGAEAGQRGDPSALTWLNRAMTLAPGWPGPHLEAGRYLVRQGHLGQGFLELREAAERGQVQSAAEIVCSPLTDHPEAVAMTIRTFGHDEVGELVLDQVARCLPRDSEATRAIDAHLVERGVLSAQVRTATRSLRSREPQRALDSLATAPNSERVLMVRARAHLALGDADRVVQELAAVTGPDYLLRVRAQAESRLGDRDAMLGTMERLRSLAAGDSRRIANVWVFQGVLLTEMSQDFDALHAFGRAHSVDRGSSGLRHTAQTAERIGEHRRASRAWGELCRAAGPGSSFCRARDRSLSRLGESPDGREQLLPTP